MADDEDSLRDISPAYDRLLVWAHLVHLLAGIDTGVDGLLEAAENRADILFTARALAVQDPTGSRTPHDIVICRLTAAIDPPASSPDSTLAARAEPSPPRAARTPVTPTAPWTPLAADYRSRYRSPISPRTTAIG